MRTVHLAAALAASCLTGFVANARAEGGPELACGSGYHPDAQGNCEPNVAETNRFCPKGTVYHPWINGGWICEAAEPPQPSRAAPSRLGASRAARVRERPAAPAYERPRATRRAPSVARSTDQARSIAGPAEAPAAAINPGFASPPAIHGGGAGGGGGGGGGGWSDRRLKRDIVRLGVSPSGLPIYAFQYVWGGPRYIGVMAQDLLKLRPDAVIPDESGYFRVDYSRIDVTMREEPAPGADPFVPEAVSGANSGAKVSQAEAFAPRG
jgi:hypothetical protein